jgi:RNA polymerase sigma-70 factor (ECF subfamily)
MPTETSAENLQSLLELARQGDDAALQQLFLLYRSYLVTLARPQIHRRLQGKVDASDLAQESLLEAHRCFTQFRGTSTPEFAGWLRSILAHRLARHLRHFFDAQARDAKLEHSLVDELDNASSILDGGLADQGDSPSEIAVARESNLMIADALESLPEDYRQVIFLRHFEGLSFAQVAESMHRSVDSVEKLWMRALARLRRNVKESHAG